MTKLLMTALLLTQTLPAGYWPLEKSQPIIDKTQTIRLSGDLSKLSDGERKAVAKLIEAGQIFQKLYEEQRHPEALSSSRALEQLDKRTGSTPATQNLLTLYRLFQGPITTTLDNKREASLPVDPIKPGKNVYPWGITKEEIEQALAAPGGQADKREKVLDLRSVVHLVNAKNLQRHCQTEQVSGVANPASGTTRRTATPVLWSATRHRASTSRSKGSRCLCSAVCSCLCRRADEGLWAPERSGGRS
jgi:hypothetical protein